MRNGDLLLFLMGSAAALAPATAVASQDARQVVRLPEQSLVASLRAVAAQFGRNVSTSSDLVSGKGAPAIDGTYSFEEAVALLLRGSGLAAVPAVPAGRGLAIRRIEMGALDETGAPPKDDIVVTGTRIRGAAPAGGNVVTIDRDDIDRSGYATTQQIVQSLPQNFGGGPNEATSGFSTRNNATANFGLGSSVNLRGLGTTSTLTLVDGNRVALGGVSGSFVDLSLIPSSAIERIEVLADGASALYGSDAVAGVVNVRLRNDFRGVEARARYGAADGFDEWQASLLGGFDWHGGHLTLGYEAYRRSKLAASDRPYVTEDLRPFGGPDYRRTFANPGTLIGGGIMYGIPTGQDGAGLAPEDLRPGQPNLADSRAATDVLPDVERHTIFGSMRQEIAPWLRFKAQGFFARRRSENRILPDNAGNVLVPATNPFYVDPIGTGAPVVVNYDFTQDLGSQTARADVRAWTTIAGIEADLGGWTGDVLATYAVQNERSRTDNVPNYFHLRQALADPDPATAFNLFGDGSYTNRTTIDRVRGFFAVEGQSRIWSAAAKFEGPLFRLPGGSARLALGTEYRRENYDARSTNYGSTAEPVNAGSAGFPLGRAITAGYAELRLPFASPDNGWAGIESLTVSLAGRVEHYSDFGTTTNPKAGISWAPIGGLSFRGSYGRSFRAPSFVDIRTGRGTSQFVPFALSDPASPTGMTPVLVLFGANPDIGPEKARTWSLGVDVVPRAVPGFKASLTYFDLTYRNRIANAGAEFRSFLANRALYGELIADDPGSATVERFYADENFINPFGIAAGDVRAIVDARMRNLSTVRMRAIDFDLGYGTNWGEARVEAGVSGTYIATMKQRITANAPVIDVVSTFGNPVDLRLRGRLSAASGPWSGAAFINYTDHYRNLVVAPAERVSSWTTLDMSVTRRFEGLPSASLSLSVTNLFDREPPYVNNPTLFSASGFDPDNASAMGRLVALQLVASW